MNSYLPVPVAFPGISSMNLSLLNEDFMVRLRCDRLALVPASFVKLPSFHLLITLLNFFPRIQPKSLIVMDVRLPSTAIPLGQFGENI